MSGASEQANGRASGPVLQSVFLVILAHGEMARTLARSVVLGEVKSDVAVERQSREAVDRQ